MTRQLFLAILFFLITTLAAATAPRSTNLLYVDGVHGNDQNDCKSRQNSCKTIGRAMSVATPGSTILVNSATYAENLVLRFDLNISGAGAETTILEGRNHHAVVSIPGRKTRVSLAGLTIRNGTDFDGCGGGIGNDGILEASDLIITDNVSNGEIADNASGAGICNNGTVILERSTVSRNGTRGSYYASGSGILNNGMMTIEDSTIANNSSDATDTYGAGIYNGDTLLINRGTIAGNHTGVGAYTEGGGIDSTGNVTINNSTIVANGSEGGQGGGIATSYSGTLTISNSTISGNSAEWGSGGISSDTLVVIRNSIIAGNGTNCSGGIVSNGYNLSSDDTCPFAGPGDLNNTEPLLGPLRNNGGPTPTMAELPGSPTVDAGNPNGCTDDQGNLLKTDQRGAPRPGKHKNVHRCDMGAFEAQTD